MRKICEIDAAEVYARSGENAFKSHWGNPNRRRPNPEWLLHAFTPAQLCFLTRTEWCCRQHPRRRAAIEVFVNEQKLAEQDWTIIGLIF